MGYKFLLQKLEREASDWLASAERAWMAISERYYKRESNQANESRRIDPDRIGGITVDPLMSDELENDRLTTMLLRMFVDQKVKRLLCMDATFLQVGNTEYQDLLNQKFDKSFFRLLISLGEEAIIKGKAWLHVYYDENGILRFMMIPAEEIIPLWRDDKQTKLEAVIRLYEEPMFNCHGSSFYRLEYWDLQGVVRFIVDEADMRLNVDNGEASGHFSIVTNSREYLLNWERVPFVCFKRGNDETPLLKLLHSLGDEYDNLLADDTSMAKQFQASIEQVVWFVNQHLANSGAGDYLDEPVRINLGCSSV